MAILGGSPLGIIGVNSSTTATGRSTFNDGNSRAVNVALYNRNSDNTYYNKNKGNSLFTGSRMVRAWPDLKSYSNGYNGSNDINDANKANSPNGSYKQRSLHNNNVYDTSVLNIIENLSGTIGALKMTDFAYLKDLGVYPNNRLMIARRFANPIGDNIILSSKNNNGPLAVLLSWQPADVDFLNISFGEKWIDAKADFKDLFNNLGGDLSKSGDSGDLGTLLGKGISSIPLPGFTEIFQRKFLTNMGIFNDDADQSIPSGNPNLIKEAKRRATVGYGDAGSGLSCTVSIEMTCEYELKFISGIDPTIAWMDILGMILSFGTSNRDTYGLNPDLGKKMENWMSRPDSLIKDTIEGLKSGVKTIAEDIKNMISNAADVNKLLSGTSSLTLQNIKDATINTAASALDTIINIGEEILEGLVKKYKVEILGIMYSLTGLPSTPWHITIGNPMRPMFCSGDMLTQDVKITLGPILAFNDLPSSIKATFILTNARSWGLQEIMAKFNSGYIRSVDTSKTMFDVKTTKNSSGKLVTQEISTLGYTTGTQSVTDTNSNTANLGNTIAPYVDPSKKVTSAITDQGNAVVLNGNSNNYGLVSPSILSTKIEGTQKPIT